MKKVFTDLTGVLSDITVRSKVVLEKFNLCKSVSTHIAYVLLFIFCVMSFHMQGKVLLAIKLFPTLVAGVIEVCAVAHFFVFK